MLQRNIKRLIHLRYLGIDQPELLLEGIGNLICLRHLVFDDGLLVHGGAKKMKLPKSIGDLYNLVVLEIKFHGFVELPETFKNLVSLTTIYFGNFHNDQLPALGQLPFLTSLTIRDFRNVESIGNEFYGGGNNRGRVAFPSLTSLVIVRLSNWKKWDDLQEGDFPRLQKLEISECDRLASLPSLQNLDLLSHMSLEYCDSLKISPEASLPPNIKRLQNSCSLELCLQGGFGELKKLERLRGKFGVRIDEVFGILKNLVRPKYLILQNADIAWNGNIKHYNVGDGFLHYISTKQVLHLVVQSKDASFSLLKELLSQTLTNLVSLPAIYFCGFHIDQLPALGLLPSLKSLTLIKMANVKSIGNEFWRGGNNHSCVAFQSLTSLAFDQLTNWEKWDELQEGDFPQLQMLTINCCRSLSSLPSFGNLMLLSHISLRECDSLRISTEASFPLNLKTLENSHSSELSLPQGFGELKKLERLSGLFGVRIDMVFGILKKLVSLKCLILSELWNAHSAWNDEACLREYSCIEKLVLNWSLPDELEEDELFDVSNEDLHLVIEEDDYEETEEDGDDEIEEDDNEETEEDNDDFVLDYDVTGQTNKVNFFVLEKLQPHINLEELYIIGYYGVGYPSWIGHPSFDRLNQVHLHSCEIEQLPTLGQLPSLEYLHLNSIYLLERIGDEFCRGINNNGRSHDAVAFPALIELVFEAMHHWEKWDRVQQGDFPKLKSLSIRGCPRLSSLSVLPNLGTNFHLSIYNCSMINISEEESFPPNMKTLLYGNFDPRIFLSPGAKLLKLESLLGVFRVRNDKLFEILNNLSVNIDRLTITALKNVYSIMELAEANLKSQQQLRLLTLKWNTDITPRDAYCSLCLVVEEHDDDDDDETNQTENASFFVLKKLQPHVDLNKLNIEGYDGVGHPSWIGHPSFSRLTEICLRSCNSDKLPTLGQLPSLDSLSLESIFSLKKIGDEFCRGTMMNNDHNNINIAFPSLRFLTFRHMHDWKKWHGVLEQDFPKLERLTIDDCPSLHRDMISLPQRLLELISKH